MTVRVEIGVRRKGQLTLFVSLSLPKEREKGGFEEVNCFRLRRMVGPLFFGKERARVS
jgi:hypothetical protein